MTSEIGTRNKSHRERGYEYGSGGDFWIGMHGERRGEHNIPPKHFSRIENLYLMSIDMTQVI